MQCNERISYMRCGHTLSILFIAYERAKATINIDSKINDYKFEILSLVFCISFLLLSLSFALSPTTAVHSHSSPTRFQQLTKTRPMNGATQFLSYLDFGWSVCPNGFYTLSISIRRTNNESWQTLFIGRNRRRKEQKLKTKQKTMTMDQIEWIEHRNEQWKKYRFLLRLLPILLARSVVEVDGGTLF